MTAVGFQAVAIILILRGREFLLRFMQEDLSRLRDFEGNIRFN
jgi:hypothetical protein